MLAKRIKRISLVLSIIAIYSFIGGMVSSVHEGFYPGDPINFQNTSGMVGVLWPISVPLWMAGEFVFIFGRLGISTLEEIDP